MKVTKKAGVFIPTGGYTAEFTKVEQVTRTGKKGEKFNAIQVDFELCDTEGQEEYAGIILNQTLWATLDSDGEIEVGRKGFQVIEAIQGSDTDDGQKSEELEDMIGNKVTLQIIAPEQEGGFPKILRVDRFIEKAPKGKAAPRNRNTDEKKPLPSSAKPTEEPAAESKAKTKGKNPDDFDDWDD